jgi:uncharacterized protein involved in exopolysaccharide biosynthesis
MLEMIFRHRWRYLSLLVVLPLIGALICIPLYPKGSAQELVWVQDQNLLNTSQPSYDYYLTPAQVTQADFEQYIQTEKFGAAVYKKLVAQGVDGSQAYSIATGLSTGLTATASGTNLLLVSYTCDHPSLCATVLSQSWQVYETYSAANENGQVKVAEQVYQQQVNQAQQQVNTATAAVNSYLAQHPGEATQTTNNDPQLSSLQQNLLNAQQTLQTAQGKLATAKGQANSNEISSSSLYSVVDAAHSQGSHLSHLPTKQMMIAAVLFWAIAAISLLVTSRLERVVRHPKQLAATLGLEVAAVMQPIPAPTSTSRALPARSRGAAA